MDSQNGLPPLLPIDSWNFFFHKIYLVTQCSNTLSNSELQKYKMLLLKVSEILVDYDKYVIQCKNENERARRVRVRVREKITITRRLVL